MLSPSWFRIGSFLGLFFSLHLAHAQPTPPPSGILEVAGKLDKQRTLGLMTLRGLNSFLNDSLKFMESIPASTPEEAMARGMIKSFGGQIGKFGFDIERGIVLSLQRPKAQQSPLPVDISLWLWLTRPDALNTLLAMLPLPPNALIRQEEPQGEIILIPTPKPDAPMIAVVRQGLRVFITLMKKPPTQKTAPWSRFLQYDRWLTSQIEHLQSLLHAQAPLDQDPSFVAANQRHLEASAFLFLNLTNLQQYIQESLMPLAAPLLQMAKGRVPSQPLELALSLLKKISLHHYEIGTTYSFAKGFSLLHELLRFNKASNPFVHLFAPKGSQIDLSAFVPATATWVSHAQFHPAALLQFAKDTAKSFLPPPAFTDIEGKYNQQLQQLKALLGVNLETEILNQLNGQLASIFQLHPTLFPLAETNGGMAFLIGVRDAASFAKSFQTLFEHAVEKRFFQGQIHKQDGKLIFQFDAAPDVSVFAALRGQALLWTLDKKTLEALLALPDQSAAWKQRLADHAAYLPVLTQGLTGIIGSFAPLKAILQRAPLPPQQQKSIQTSFNLFGNFFLKAQHTPDTWESHLAGTFTKLADLKPADPNAAPDNSAPQFTPIIPNRALKKKVKAALPFIAGFLGIAAIPLFSSPALSTLTLLGGGAAVAIPAFQRFQRKSRRNQRKLFEKRGREIAPQNPEKAPEKPAPTPSSPQKP
jgi:hypothetical protein